MRRLFLLLFLFPLFLLAAADYDCIFIGTSPIPLFEALYQAHSGKKVLILEQAGEAGGAWKSVEVCGVPHVDLGCHLIGSDNRMKEFLETYAGCHLISLDQLQSAHAGKTSHGFYFSMGCYELIDHLLRLLSNANVPVLYNHKIDTVSVPPTAEHAIVKAQGEQFTAKKVFLTHAVSLEIETGNPSKKSRGKPNKFHHLYLLIQDPNPPQFSYMGHLSTGISRIMNLTHYVDLSHTGRQLIVIQVHGEQYLRQAAQLMEELKTKNLLSSSAYLLESETLTYEQVSFDQSQFQQCNRKQRLLFELINAASFGGDITSFLDRWKMTLKPYAQIFPNG